MDMAGHREHSELSRASSLGPPHPTADKGRNPFLRQEQLLLGDQLQAALDDVGCPPSIPVRPYHPPRQIPLTQPQYRDQIIPHRHMDLRLHERLWQSKGQGAAATMGGLAGAPGAWPGTGRCPQSPACCTWPRPGSRSRVGGPQVLLRPPDCPWGWREVTKALGGLHLTSLNSYRTQSPTTFAFLASGLPLLTHKHTPQPMPI